MGRTTAARSTARSTSWGRRAGGVLFFACLALFAAAATAAAGPTEPEQPAPDDGSAPDDGASQPDDPNDLLGEDFQEVLADLMQDAGIDLANTDINTLLGEPGDLDLPPGELVVPALIDQVPETTEAGGGSSLTGPCMGVAISFGSDGKPIDMAVDFNDPGAPVDVYDSDFTGDAVAYAFTSDNPFKVDVNGYVAYAGTASPAPTNHTWKVEVQGVNLDSGGDDNPDMEDRNAGSVDLASQLPSPVKINGLFKISGDMHADGGFECLGSGYFETTNGFPTAAVGVLLLGLAGVGAFFNARPARTW